MRVENISDFLRQITEHVPTIPTFTPPLVETIDLQQLANAERWIEATKEVLPIFFNQYTLGTFAAVTLISFTALAWTAHRETSQIDQSIKF